MKQLKFKWLDYDAMQLKLRIEEYHEFLCDSLHRSSCDDELIRLVYRTKLSTLNQLLLTLTYNSDIQEGE